MGHGSRCEACQGGAAPFGALGGRVGDLTGLEDAALAAVSAEDVREVLRLGPPELQRAVLDVVRLGGAKKIPAGAPEQVLRTLRHGDQRRRGHLRVYLGGVFVHGFGNADELGADDCARLLGAGTAAEVLERAPGLRSLLGWDAPVAFVRWGLVRVIVEDRPLAVVALGLLAAEPAERMPGARALWEALREEHPELPERPVGMLEMRAIAAGEQEAAPDPERLEAELEELRGRFVTAADAAERVAGCLRDGHRPDDGDLVAVQCVAADFDGLGAQILPGERPAGLDELAALVRAAAEAGRRDARVRALRRIEGPDSEAELLAELRRAADGGDDELAVLAELVQVRAEDRLRAPALAERARAELPGRWHRLIDLALVGELAIGDAPGDEPGPGSVEPQVPGRVDGPPAAEASGPAEMAAGTSAPVQETAAPEPVTTGDRVVGVPAPREAPVAETVRDERRAEDDALDAFLEGAVGVQPQPAARVERRRDRAARPAGETPPEPEASETGLADELVRAEDAALRDRRFGLAGWLRKAAGRPDAEVDARWCAALAPEMGVYAGSLSAEFAAASRDLDAKALADDPAGGVLAWAAAIRAGLVYPETARVVECLNVVVSGQAVLKECGEAFAQAARAGVYLGPGMDGWIRGAAELAQARGDASRDAARLLEEAPHRTVKLARATEVWKALLPADGELRRLLRPAAEDDAARAAEVAAEVVRLRGGAGVDRLIDETDKRVNGPKKGKPIIAGARRRLRELIDDALGTAGRWAAAVKEHEDAASGDRDWRVVPLRQLRDAVTGRRAEIDAALAALAGTAGEAAADAARYLLGGAFALLDGAKPAETEPPAAHVRNRDLLPAPGLALDPRTLEPAGELALADLAAVAHAGPPDWARVFEARAARLDHGGTRAVVSVLETLDAEAASRLRARRDELVGDARDRRDERVERLRDLIAMSRRDGLLTEGEEREAEEAVRLLTAGDRHDFDRIGRELDALRARLERLCDASVAAAREALAEARRAGDLRAADIERIEDHIEGRDLTTAREFIAQLKAGRQLPEKAESPDFERFYPAFPDVFHRHSRQTGKRARKQETSGYIDALKDALIAGRDVAEPDLYGLLAGAGIDIRDMREASRRVAGEGLRKWVTLREGRSKSPGNLRSLIDAMLKMVGLEGTHGDADQGPDRMWIVLDDVRHVGSVGGALLPAFGSQKSPSGGRLRLLLHWGRPGPQQLVDLLNGQPEGETVLVLYFGVLSADDRAQLGEAARKRRAPVAGVLDDAAIAYLACRPQDWSVAVALMAPFTATDPYTPTGGVPEEMFYGRSEQLRKVTDRRGPSFVFGGRQLGKSALLRKAERDLASDPNRTVILETIQTVGKVRSISLWPILGDRLAKAGVVRSGLTGRDQVIDAVRGWAAADGNRQLLILLDEADAFLNRDAERGRFEDVTALRTLMEDTGRRVKVVWAGLHQTARFHGLPNQPLAQLGEPIAIGPLDPQDAFDLLVRPLATLGFTFPETLAARVIAEANNAPALVQLFAGNLLARLRETPRPLPYEITREDVAEVWRDQKLVDGFQKRFDYTLTLDKRYKVIAYTVALHALDDGAGEALTVRQLREECRYWWARGFENCSGDDFRSLLDECVNLGVLGVDDGRYRLRTPHVLRLLGGVREIENVLESAADFDGPDEFDAHSYRMPHLSGPDRAPLSIGQITGLLRPGRLVHVVAGSAALHAERVAASLQAMPSDRSDLEIRVVRPGEGTFDSAVLRARRHPGHDVIVADLHAARDGEPFERRFAEARHAVADRSGEGTLSVVLVAGPAAAAGWLRYAADDDVELVPLRRFDGAAIRQWMLEDSLGFPDDAGQRELVRRTGGWPTLVGRVVTGLAGRDRDQALDEVLRQVRAKPAAFLDDTGVLADPCLAAAWRVLVEEDDRGTAEDLAALLTLYGEEGTDGLTSADLREHGYDGTADLVEALRVLGALESADGVLGCEPVLAGATRRAAAG
ncbi:hypothetical protein [Actinomadura latina]|uniref:Uncharacterized protein n=1 Tax=Actinomadura latina TaxID=163603 RepID=A0A846Z7D2_9ACTN|nr:hypothetical protein [Actinomadura latina]NKZ06303.1 hypothetical protein [Actinomadura latina]